jgi:hypothetical protein
MISKEEYAALREQIIAELKEEKRARDQARIKLNEAVATIVSVVIELLCERNEMTLYKNGRAEEANKLLAQLLEEKIERHKKNAEQQ